MATRPALSEAEIEEKVAEASERIVHVRARGPQPPPVVMKLVVKEQPKPDPTIMRMTVKTRVEPPRPAIHYHVATSKRAKGNNAERK
jgi:hypothetical protein